MNKNNYIGFKVTSNLMAPTFVIGDVVILDKNILPKSGECGGFILNGNGYICEYQEEIKEKYLLFKNFKIKVKPTDCFEIIGKLKNKFKKS